MVKKIILTYGTFDLFHYGHERFLLRLKRQADKLIVGVSTDEYNNFKNKKSFQNQEERFAIIAHLPYVDKVIWEHEVLPQWLSDYRKYQVTKIVLGSDHIGELDYLRNYGINIEYVERTKKISSSLIKHKILTKMPKYFYCYGFEDISNLKKEIWQLKQNYLIVLIIPKKITDSSWDLFSYWNKQTFIDLCLIGGKADFLKTSEK